MVDGNIFSSIPGVGWFSGQHNWTVIGLWIFVIIIICLGFFALGYFIWLNEKTVYTLEVDSVSHRIQVFNSTIIRDVKSGVKRLFIRKYGKQIPYPQQSDMFYKGKRDSTILVKDNNGLHHSLRILTFDELKEFMLKIKGIDITQKYITKQYKDRYGKLYDVKQDNPYFNYYQVYAMPNPQEDLDYLADEIEEAQREFSNKVPWYLSPNFMVIGTAFICFMMVLVTLLLKGRA